jgi:hypothetical protein
VTLVRRDCLNRQRSSNVQTDDTQQKAARRQEPAEATAQDIHARLTSVTRSTLCDLHRDHRQPGSFAAINTSESRRAHLSRGSLECGQDAMKARWIRSEQRPLVASPLFAAPVRSLGARERRQIDVQCCLQQGNASAHLARPETQQLTSELTGRIQVACASKLNQLSLRTTKQQHQCQQNSGEAQRRQERKS